MPKTSPVRVAIATHGCKLNQAESETMGRQFAEAGYSLVAADQPADIYILNTCTVTHVADGKARRWLRAAYRRNPEATVVATGCYAERDAEGLAWVEGVGLVVGNRNKGRLLELVQGLGVREKYGSLPAANGGGPSLGSACPSRTRAFVKIQDGCNQFCTFCIAPFTRDREANVPINDVIDQVRARVREGYKEIVITGPQIGSYGLYPPNSETRRDPDDYDGRLHGLVERILGETGVPRLRISSIQPQDLTARLLDAWQDQRLCRHVHMALQSGSDAVLGRMRRRYSTAQYRRAIERLRGVVPGIAMTTDVMVGFPGETREEFEESYRFCREMEFAGMHVFPFSPRPGTRAAEMPGKVADEVKKGRVGEMLVLARGSAARFCRSFIGRTAEVLWEGEERIGGEAYWSGLTDNYIRVYTRDTQVEPNRLMYVTLLKELEDGLIGEVRAAAGVGYNAQPGRLVCQR